MVVIEQPGGRAGTSPAASPPRAGRRPSRANGANGQRPAWRRWLGQIPVPVRLLLAGLLIGLILGLVLGQNSYTPPTNAQRAYVVLTAQQYERDREIDQDLALTRAASRLKAMPNVDGRALLADQASRETDPAVKTALQNLQRDLAARGDDRGLPWLWIILIVLGLVIAAAVALWWWRGRTPRPPRRTRPAPASAAAPEAGAESPVVRLDYQGEGTPFERHGVLTGGLSCELHDAGAYLSDLPFGPTGFILVVNGDSATEPAMVLILSDFAIDQRAGDRLRRRPELFGAALVTAEPGRHARLPVGRSTIEIRVLGADYKPDRRADRAILSRLSLEVALAD